MDDPAHRDRPGDDLRSLQSFDWDEGNAEKNWIRHRVTRGECEEVFFHRPLVVRQDRLHSRDEDRFFALGQTSAGRLLFLAFTHRGERLRVISARDMTPKSAG